MKGGREVVQNMLRPLQQQQQAMHKMPWTRTYLISDS